MSKPEQPDLPDKPNEQPEWSTDRIWSESDGAQPPDADATQVMDADASRFDADASGPEPPQVEAPQVETPQVEATQVMDAEAITAPTSESAGDHTTPDPAGNAPIPAGTAVEGAADTDTATTSDASRRRPLLILLAGVAIVALVAGVVWAFIVTSAASRDNAIRDTATTYLTAVANGDAEAALETLQERPANTTLLTNDVLNASREAAPITEVTIGSVASEGRDATAQVSYKLGEQQVQTTVALIGDGRTTWKIADGTSELMLNETRALTVNGATLTEPANPVFPGSYTAASLNGYTQLTAENLTAVFPSPDTPPIALTVTHGLSEAGQQAVTGAVKARFEECLASKESMPAGCPFGVANDGVELTPEGVTYQLTNDPWTGMVSELDPAAMSAGGIFHFEVSATATVARDGLTTTLTLPLVADRGYRIDLTKEPLVVTWW